MEEARIVISGSEGLGQKEVVTAAHNACIQELLQEIEVHGKDESSPKAVQ